MIEPDMKISRDLIAGASRGCQTSAEALLLASRGLVKHAPMVSGQALALMDTLLLLSAQVANLIEDSREESEGDYPTEERERRNLD